MTFDIFLKFSIYKKSHTQTYLWRVRIFNFLCVLFFCACLNGVKTLNRTHCTLFCCVIVKNLPHSIPSSPIWRVYKLQRKVEQFFRAKMWKVKIFLKSSAWEKDKDRFVLVGFEIWIWPFASHYMRRPLINISQRKFNSEKV